MHPNYQSEIEEPRGAFDQFISTCPRCGGSLRLSSYKLEYQSRKRRECQANVPISSDGFTVCDDLWGTRFENGDQSTSDEVVECADCGRLGPLLMHDTADAQVVSVRASMLQEALDLLASIRPMSTTAVREMGYDPRAELIADLKAALA
jgi:hypothetical protein